MTKKPIIAKTIKDLRDALTNIIDSGYGDFEWYGFDDESIYIYKINENSMYSDSIQIKPN